MLQKGLFERTYQQAAKNEETKALISKIFDKQTKFAELSRQLMEYMQKIVVNISRQFEKEIKLKQREMRKIQRDHEIKIKEIKNEYEADENNCAAQMVKKQSQYITALASIHQEQQLFIKFLDHNKQGQNDNYSNVIEEILIDSLAFQENHKINNFQLNEFIQQKNKQQILTIHNSLQYTITQLQKIEETLHSSINTKHDTHLHQLVSKLTNFMLSVKSGQGSLETLLQEMQMLQQEQKEQNIIRNNNLTLISSLLKSNYDSKDLETLDFSKNNESTMKLIDKIIEINQNYQVLQKQSQEDFYQLLELTNLKNDKLKPNDAMNRKSTLKLSGGPIPPRLRIFSESKKDILNDLGDLTLSITTNQMVLESQLLYQPTPLLSISKPFNSQQSTTQCTFVSHGSTSVKAEKYYKESKNYRSLMVSDKKTALPLRCTCPPQCLCQAQIIRQLHSCVNQLYINSKGEVICKTCNFAQQVQEYSFYCPQFKTRNRFKSSRDFLSAFWQHIKTLTVNQQIVEFWNQLSLCCQHLWISDMIDDISNNLIIERNFISCCPSGNRCYHKSSNQQYHVCQIPLLINSNGQIVCKKCHYQASPEQYYIQCPDSKEFNLFLNQSDFISSLDLPVSRPDESEESNFKFIKLLEKNLPLIWN